MKQIVIKNGPKTTYKWVPDDWEEQEKPMRDMTTSGRKLMDTGLTKERYEQIFGKKPKENNNL